MAERPPRVVFAIGSLARGGSERQMVQLIAAAHPERLEATVLAFSNVSDSGLAQLLRDLGVDLIQLAPTRGPRPLRPLVSVPRTYGLLRRARPDVVYSWLEEASATVTPAARALGVPVVIARRSVCGSPSERWAFFRVPIRFAERHAALVTGNSEAVIAEAEARGVAPNRLRLARNGHPQISPLPAPAGEEVVIGYLANYRAEKGHRRLLDALELVETETPWRVDLAGDGPLRDQVSAEIAARGLGPRVTTGGPVLDVPGFWSDRDIAVLLSDDEGSPNVLIEAALLGRPLVGTDGGGTREIVTADGGLLVSHDPAEIAAALERLIDDRELRLTLGQGARQHALAHHDLERSVDAHLAAIREAVDGRRA